MNGWIIFPFDVEEENANLDTFLKDEFIEAKSTYAFKEIGYYWMSEKLAANYPKFC